ITLERLVELMADNPRRLFGLGGGVTPGDEADFTVLELDEERTVDPATFRSKGHATPFAGWRIRGHAVLTVVGGRTVYEDTTTKSNA
ncbi:MAG: dihydroorotase, partial [Alistipes sp.]|nr:dihydroorotase [Alistipes sp.]